MTWLAICSAVLAVNLVAAYPLNAAEADQPKWHPWVELGGLGADGDNSRGVVELWSPLSQGPTALFFFDGKFQFIADDVLEGNAQFGLRKMTTAGWNLGAWLSGDVRETSLDNTFWQVSGGLEALSVKWDLRVNGYLPVTDPQVSPSTAELVLKRNNLFLIGGQEVALHGVDGEIGYLLFGSPETQQGTRHEFRVYGGGFWFEHSDAIDEVSGPSARIEWRIDDVIPDWGGSRLTFDAGYSHDELRDDLWEVGLRLRIPLGGAKTYALLSPQARRMQERIERDDDIVTVQSGPEKVRDTLTGVRFDRVAYVNPSITEVSAEAGDNSLLIVNGTVAGPQSLQGNQTLMGGQSTIQVTGVKSGVTKSFTAPGPAAELVDPGTGVNLTLLGSNTDVAGLNIHGVPTVGFSFGNPAGISGPGPLDNIVIQQTSVADTGFAGISFGAGNTNVRIFDTTITDGGVLGGIFFGIDNSDLTISRVAVADTSGTGIFLGVGARHVEISDTTVMGIGLGSGIGIGTGASDVTLSHVTVADIFSFGITASSNNTHIAILDSSVSSTGGSAIRFIDNNSNVTIKNTTVTDTGIEFGSGNSNVTIVDTTVTNAGIQFVNNNTGVTIAGTSITGGSIGILFGFLNSNVTIANTTITDPAIDGIDFANGNSNLMFAGLTITNPGADGIFLGDGNSNVLITGTTITSPGGNGISLQSTNNVVLNDSTLAGTFGLNGIDILDNNTVNGVGNTAAGATFPAGNLCQDSGLPWAGTIVFDGVAITSANCP